jgi:hypothetical protein
MSASKEPLNAALRDPRVSSAIDFGDNRFALRLRGQDRWIVTQMEEHPAADLAKGWQARSAHPDADFGMNAKVISEKDLLSGLDDRKTVLVLHQTGDRPYFQVASNETPPPGGGSGGTITLSDGGEVPAWSGPEGDPIVLLADLRRDGRDFGDVMEMLTSDNVDALRKAAKGEHMVASDFASRRGQVAMQDLDGGRIDLGARFLAEDPKEMQRLLRVRLQKDASAADTLDRQGRIEDAIGLLDDSIAKFGRVPDLVLRRDLLLLAKEKPLLASAGSQRALPPLRDPESLFREIHAHQARALGRQAEDLKVLETYAHASDQSAHDLGAIGHPGLSFDGGKIELAYYVDHLPGERIIPAAKDLDVEARIVDVYVADDPSLNSLDWHANMNRTLTTLLERDEAKVVRLPMGGVDQYHPTVVHVVAEQKVAHFKGSLHPPTSSGTSSNCDANNPANCNHESYVVLPKAS